ncbi:hypothetical protein GJAV_G00042950 [Gymnothorax javanicus]|nr:hypothetical protein GJAV_G00042950 [Gymnothorax javanicus]
MGWPSLAQGGKHVWSVWGTAEAGYIRARYIRFIVIVIGWEWTTGEERALNSKRNSSLPWLGSGLHVRGVLER